jgi:hypothetical protein
MKGFFYPDNLIFLSGLWPILPGKYMQVLSISHKMAGYFAFPLLL